MIRHGEASSGRQRPRSTALAVPETKREQPKLPIDLSVISGLRSLHAGSDGDPVDQMVRGFLDNARTHVGDIRDAALAGDGARVQEVAHTLRGSSGTFGAHRLSRMCRFIEIETRDQGRIVPEETLEELTEEFGRVDTEFRAVLELEVAES